MPWKRRLTRFRPLRVNWASWVCRCFSSRKAMIRWQSVPFARSRVSPTAPGAASMREVPRICARFWGRLRALPRVGARRSRIMANAPAARRSRLPISWANKVLYFLIGSALLVLLLVLGRAFVAADPATLSRLWRPTAFTAALLLGLALSVANLRLLPVAFGVILIPLLILRRTSPPASAPGGSSEVETRYLRMRLDHASGAMSGVVREGTLSGRRLEELTLEDLIALWRECRLGDEPSADLLEAYLDRTHRDWRKAR